MEGDSTLPTDKEKNVVVLLCLVTLEVRYQKKWDGKEKGYRGSIAQGSCLWYADYLNESPLYTPERFRQRFRSPLKLVRRFVLELLHIEPDLMQ